MGHKENASDMVLEAMKEKLITGQWKPGMKIPGEMAIAQELNVSRASVREAMERLVAVGIVTRRRGDGTYIQDLSSASLFQQLLPDMMLHGYVETEILDFREMLEPECAERFARRHRPEQLRELEECCRIMEETADTDRKRFADADLKFHLLIAQGCGNPIMARIMDIIRDVMSYYQYSASALIGPQTGAAEHRRILEAFQAKDGELAALLLKRHIQRSKRDIAEQRKDG